MSAELQWLNLSYNRLSGPLANFSVFPKLEVLDLSSNNFSGKVSSDLISLPELRSLNLGSNALEGDVPLPTSRPLALQELVLSGNQFVGQIPADLFRYSNLTMLDLSQNNLTGMPASLSTALNLSHNYLNGPIPPNVGFLKELEILDLSYNNLSGQLSGRLPIFGSYVSVISNGNPGLTNVTQDNTDSTTSSRRHTGLIIIFALAGTLIGLIVVVAVEAQKFRSTLSSVLHGGSSEVLDWPSRYSIALGVAQGLTFLHSCTQPVLLLDLSTKTIHLKSTNEPQIGDIELCKIIDPSRSTGSFSTIAGTVGYIPPEYAYTMRLTMAGNIYSFGVILLELLTGKPAVSEGTELAKWALSLSARPDQRDQILDSRVSRTSAAVQSQMLSVLNIALSCVAFSPDARPKMRNILRSLFNAK
ncbi:hypothetical protein PR202_gb00359 [Eleusine coracana subsp. coracana]|uniref:Protein kinase domain-containing protein n=1 Tax=Eleusine coracana subsp. coracana TaxID=191504 RepID=A0AAV5DRC6_ELECO|nr:hypothetical protein PR202_gb00359 [Eleusine coracana subsp. coracana]